MIANELHLPVIIHSNNSNKLVVEIFERYGAINAANLDGGQSSSLVINNKLYNNPPAAAKAQGGRYVVTGWGLIP